MERRTAIVELDADALTGALRQVLPDAELLEHRLAEGGRANTNYVLSSTRGTFVLRIHVRSAASCAKEAALHRRVAHAVPLAERLGCGMLDGPGHPFTLLRYVEGCTLAELVTRGRQQAVLACGRALGRALGELHRVRFERIGDLQATAPDASLAVVDFGFDDFARHCLFEARAGERLGPLRDRLWALLQRERERHPDPLPVQLVHGDFNPTNLLVRDDGALAAVLDWEFAHAGVLWGDLGNLLRNRPECPLPDGFEDALLAGLDERGVALPPHWRELCLRVDLGSALEFLNSGDDRPQTQARALAQIRQTMQRLGDN